MPTFQLPAFIIFLQQLGTQTTHILELRLVKWVHSDGIRLSPEQENQAGHTAHSVTKLGKYRNGTAPRLRETILGLVKQLKSEADMAAWTEF